MRLGMLRVAAVVAVAAVGCGEAGRESGADAQAVKQTKSNLDLGLFAGGWTRLPTSGGFKGRPAVISRAGGADFFAVTSAGLMVENNLGSPTWERVSAPTQPGHSPPGVPSFDSGPSAAPWMSPNSGASARTAIGISGGALMQNTEPGEDEFSTWGNWVQVSGGTGFAQSPQFSPAIAALKGPSPDLLNLVACAPKPTSGGTPPLIYCARNRDFAHNFPASAWSEFSAVNPPTGAGGNNGAGLPSGVSLASGPSLVTLGTNIAPAGGPDSSMVVLGSDSQAYGSFVFIDRISDQLTFGAWEVVGCCFASDIAIAEGDTVGLTRTLFGRGFDNFIWQRTTFTESSFSRIPNGIFSSGPAASALASNLFVVAALGTDSQVWYNTWRR